MKTRALVAEGDNCDGGAGAQKVRVEEEVEAYPTGTVDLRCQFIDGGGRTKLTQVSWIWEPSDGQRDNIAVYHPIYGQSFPNLGFKDRVVFLHNSLENPSIRISGLKMSDAGRYTCEYATYPSGNEQGTTTLVMLDPPSVSIVGYDNNWYIGRSDAALLCLATANPEPTSVTWTTASGPLPDTVAVDGNKLSVRKVDDAVNTTFICEAKNKHGASRQQITTVVIGADLFSKVAAKDNLCSAQGRVDATSQIRVDFRCFRSQSFDLYLGIKETGNLR
ncbi:hypothetical protein F2P81_023040 [Scophthalmus maximus]|uniref:Ig-like domain-containing protein n=1 Tax=Scophthalmus maximus TaxID=52904 RepID=A0A6A4RWE4_SCOMX|nr:hypothetical protein F2P81_023040 [Scophthalmus maximus]